MALEQLVSHIPFTLFLQETPDLLSTVPVLHEIAAGGAAWFSLLQFMSWL